MSKLITFSEDQINDIVKAYSDGKSLREIGEKYGVSRPTIQKVVQGNYSGYVGKRRAAEANEKQTKVCSKCGQSLPLEAFNRGNSLYGRRSFCRECEKTIQKTTERVKRRREREKERRKNPNYVLHRNYMDKQRRLLNPKHWLWVSAKNRAKKKGWEFNITEDDYEIPESCPLLEIPMCKNPEQAQDNSYSLDRIDPSKGYIPGNVWVVSNRANRIKGDATLEELELIVKNLKDHWIH